MCAVVNYVRMRKQNQWSMSACKLLCWTVKTTCEKDITAVFGTATAAGKTAKKTSFSLKAAICKGQRHPKQDMQNEEKVELRMST